jgi:hypothetical protein
MSASTTHPSLTGLTAPGPGWSQIEDGFHPPEKQPAVDRGWSLWSGCSEQLQSN